MRMSCACSKLGSMARKRRGSKSFTITTEDLVFTGLGALGGLALNYGANQLLASQPENTKNMARKALPALKVVGGGSVAINKKMDRKTRFLGIGMAATGSIELGKQVAPQFFGIAGIGNADVFALIGDASSVSIPIAPAKGAHEEGNESFETEPILGATEDMMIL